MSACEQTRFIGNRQVQVVWATLEHLSEVQTHACACAEGRYTMTCAFFPLLAWEVERKVKSILIACLHMARIHECCGFSEHPNAMWGMKGKPQSSVLQLLFFLG